MTIGRNKGPAKPRIYRGGEARQRSVGTKMSKSEYHRVLNAAGSLTPSEWLRKVALAAADRQPIETVVLIETLAHHRMMLNLVVKLAGHQPITAADVKTLQAEIDRDKLQRAYERLEHAEEL